jgi:predicted nucleic acid-binding protein
MNPTLYLDSNVIIRLIIGDVPNHLREARAVFKQIEEGKATGCVSVLVVNEVVWILEHYYELERKIYIPQLMQLLALKQVKILEVKKQLLMKVLNALLLNSCDLTDNYLAEVGKNHTVVSFDTDLERLKNQL